MVKMDVVYEGDLRTTITHLPSKQTLETDAPTDHGGQGRTFSPTDLVAAGLGSCIATVIGMYAAKKGWDLRGMRVEVEKQMSKSPPRRIAKLTVDLWIPIELSDEDLEKVKKVAESCPVHHSLHSETEISITFHKKE